MKHFRTCCHLLPLMPGHLFLTYLTLGVIWCVKICWTLQDPSVALIYSADLIEVFQFKMQMSQLLITAYSD